MNGGGDIELEIGAGSAAGQYEVRVLRAAAGGEPAGTLNLDVDEVLSKRDLLEATVLASAVARRSVSVAERPVRQVGRELFEALFTGPVYGMYRASMGMAQQRGQRLRVVLRLTAPELAALPWEMLFDRKPRPTCAGRNRWYATSMLPIPQSRWRSARRCGFSAWSPRRGACRRWTWTRRRLI